MTSVRNGRRDAHFWRMLGILGVLAGSIGCDGAHPKRGLAPSPSPSASASAASVPSAAFEASKVEVQDEAMGTSLHFIAYTSPQTNEAATRAAIAKAIAEMRRLEAILSEWKPESEIGRVNAHPGDWVAI